MEPDGSLPCPQEPATGTDHKSDALSPQRTTLFL
jgi:hypothetical protein